MIRLGRCRGRGGRDGKGISAARFCDCDCGRGCRVRRGNGGVDAEGLEEGVEPAFVQVHLLVAETKEGRGDIGEEGNGLDEDTKLEAEDRLFKVYAGSWS